MPRLASRLSAAAESIINALTDPARRGRTVAVVLIGFVAAWTLYGVLAKGGQGAHFDMTELAELSRHPGFGNAKNPPFAIWITGLWFAIFPRTDWSFYLLAMTGVGVAVWASWQLFGRVLEGEKRVLALALLTLIPLLTFHALKLNNNALMIPLWALTTLFFLRSFEERKLGAAALAGMFAAFALLTKYWSIFLIAGLALAAFTDRRRNAYFASPMPWVTALGGALVLAPHVLWLFANEFPSFSYALAVHGGRAAPDIARSVIFYLAGTAAYGAPVAALWFLIARPSRKVLRDVLLPPAGPRRFMAVVFWAGILLPVPVAFAFHSEIVSLWTMPAWSLLPAILLSAPGIKLSRVAVHRAVVLAISFPIAAVLAAPAIALMIHRSGSAGVAAYYQPLAREVERAWQSASAHPLQYVGGDAGYGVAFYLPRAATVFPLGALHLAPWLDASEVARAGIVLACSADAEGCVAHSKEYAAKFPRFFIEEVSLANRYLGIEGRSRKFVILVVPPQKQV